MKLFLGWVVSAGVLVTAAAANAQVLLPLRISDALVTTASDVVGATVSTVSDVGGPYAAIPPGPPRYAPPVLPPREITAILRESGFSPLGAPQQRGLVYTVSAIDMDGEDGRLVIDARSGRILRFMPAWRMRDRMGEETITTYGPAGPLPPDYRRAPRPPASLPKVASRTPTVPLPKAMPPRAVATPTKPVAVTPTPAPAAAPVQQSAVTEPKAVEAAPAAAAPAATPTPPTVAAAPVEAKPAAPAAESTPAMPPVQGLE
jgi:hypothetical protein